MSRFALEEWLNEASGDVAGGQAPSMTPDSLTGGAPAGDPNAANPPGQMAPDSPAQQQNSPEAAKRWPKLCSAWFAQPATVCPHRILEMTKFPAESSVELREFPPGNRPQS